MPATMRSSEVDGVRAEITEHAVTSPVMAPTHAGRMANNSLIADIFCSSFNIGFFLRLLGPASQLSGALFA